MRAVVISRRIDLDERRDPTTFVGLLRTADGRIVRFTNRELYRNGTFYDTVTAGSTVFYDGVGVSATPLDAEDESEVS